MKTTHTSHEAFGHDSLDSLGFDWSRVADPNTERRLPLKVYLPSCTDDVVIAMKETKVLGQVAKIRSKGHSSNDLVIAKGGIVICTEMLNAYTHEPASGVVRVQGGAVLAEVDEYLAGFGMGLPVIGDHNHITAGGFASVGGISPASHRHGLFVDNVISVEYVTWDGEVRNCSRTQRPGEFNRLLTGTGRHGLITWMECRVESIEKFRTIVRNERRLFLNVDAFVEASSKLISDPGGCLYERGVWVEYPVGPARITVGQFSTYFPTKQSWAAKLRKRLAYGYLHFLGRIAGRLPATLDRAIKILGLVGIILSPRYGSVKDVECFTDKVIDSSVGDPTRMLIILAPTGEYAAIFKEMLSACEQARAQKAITFISFYVKAITSDYLSSYGKHPTKYAELMLYLGVVPDRMTSIVLDQLVAALDGICVKRGGLRYMHTKTSKDEAVLAMVDPNRRYAQA